MLDWLIIGGGIHGTYLSLYLTRRRRIPADQVRVLDPHPQPLALWQHFTANTGMSYLRSPHAHNLHYDPFSLITFTRTNDGQPLADFIEPYGRPSLQLFNTHSQTLIERYHLDELRLLGRATGLHRLAEGWQVATNNGTLEARNVILAFSNTERPYWPDWARTAQAEGANIHHLFDPAFTRATSPGHTLVVGGGITAAQTATALALESSGSVTLLMRHPPRIHQFDSDLGWITHQHLDGFYQDADYARRRHLIRTARHRGSMPPDVVRELEAAVQHGILDQRIDEVKAVRYQHGKLYLTLESGDTLTTDRIILATGFETSRPGGAWLDAAIKAYGLPVAEDGFPIVDQRLCWSEGLFVSGSLAELEIGPVARNFIGVKLAAERIGAGL
ncbi:MAG: NAD(P)-binding domain-containing protein [Chloroflexi bacterium]|nr:NAD(P)-binding domain-containing protein [Chloroflexota bacterium]MCC6891965.1 SidA/IucD/PvdA family monooxygenase [Anaerolineae bacterium]